MYQRVDYAIVTDKLRARRRRRSFTRAAGGVHYWEWYMADA